MKFKNIASIVSALAAAVCVFTSYSYTSAETKTLTLGDVNGDSLVNAVDASEVLSEYARTSTGGAPLFTDEQKLCGDIDKDGAINAIDASHILSYYAYRSTGGTLTFEEYLSPTETTTDPDTTRQFAYPLEQITQSAEVFNYFAEQMNHDITQGTDVLTRRFNSEEYWDNGEMESRVALLLLNENANYNDGVLRTVFSGYDDIDIADGVLYFFKAPTFEEICNGDIDFNNYSLDQNIGNYMNELNNKRKNNDISEMDKIIEDFFYNNVYEKAYHNMASFYYTVGTGAGCLESNYSGICLGFADDGNFYGIQEIVEDKVKKLIR